MSVKGIQDGADVTGINKREKGYFLGLEEKRKAMILK